MTPYPLDDAAKKNKYIRCRKKVVCHTKCECGKYEWEACWQPNKEESRFLYGIAENYALAGRPYCQLLRQEEIRKKEVCSSSGATKACKETP